MTKAKAISKRARCMAHTCHEESNCTIEVASARPSPTIVQAASKMEGSSSAATTGWSDGSRAGHLRPTGRNGTVEKHADATCSALEPALPSRIGLSTRRVLDVIGDP